MMTAVLVQKLKYRDIDHPSIIGSTEGGLSFHQFLPEIDEDKKYPDNPVDPV
jgi:hypothetical protein